MGNEIVTCKKCKGSGKLRREECKTCRGSGKVTLSVVNLGAGAGVQTTVTPVKP